MPSDRKHLAQLLEVCAMSWYSDIKKGKDDEHSWRNLVTAFAMALLDKHPTIRSDYDGKD